MSCAAEALYKPISYKLSAESVARILTATVAVKDSSFEPAILLAQLFYGVYAELFLHVIMHFKSDYLAIEAVKDRRYIELPVRAVNISDIGQKFLQRCSSREISFYQVLSVLSCCVSLCYTVRSMVPVDKPSFAHCAIYRSEAYMSATLYKKLPCTWLALIPEPAIIS